MRGDFSLGSWAFTGRESQQAALLQAVTVVMLAGLGCLLPGSLSVLCDHHPLMPTVPHESHCGLPARRRRRALGEAVSQALSVLLEPVLVPEHRTAGEAPRASCLEGTVRKPAAPSPSAWRTPLLASYSASRKGLQALGPAGGSGAFACEAGGVVVAFASHY